MKEHVPFKDHLINTNKDIMKSHYFRKFCCTYIIKESCHHYSINPIRKVKRYSEKVYEYPSKFYCVLCKSHIIIGTFFQSFFNNRTSLQKKLFLKKRMTSNERAILNAVCKKINLYFYYIHIFPTDISMQNKRR